MNEICRHYLISGHVQGVCFRTKTQNTAETLNITGWIKNLNDGRIEVIACGTPEQLEKLQTTFHNFTNISNIVQKTLPYQFHNKFVIHF